MEEPWPLPLLSLGDVVIDPDPEGGVGEEGGEWGGRGERRRGRRQGEERRAVHCLLFLGEGGGGALASSSPISRRCHDGSGSGAAVKTNKHKHSNKTHSTSLY